MKKKKLNLVDLKITSFKTELNSASEKTIQGGWSGDSCEIWLTCGCSDHCTYTNWNHGPQCHTYPAQCNTLLCPLTQGPECPNHIVTK